MNNQELTAKLVEKTGLSAAEVAKFQAACIEKVLDEIAQGNTVSFQGFGNFELKEKAQRKMYNPTKKEFNVIPARQTVGFRPSTVLKEKIKG